MTAKSTAPQSRTKKSRWPRGADGLTDMERKTWRVMLDLQAATGVAARLSDVQTCLGRQSQAGVQARVKKLVELGYAERRGYGARPRYLAVEPDDEKIEYRVVRAELIVLKNAHRVFREREGRPATFGEAIASIAEEWLAGVKEEER